MPLERYAVVRLTNCGDVAPYLPENYRIHSSALAEPVNNGRHHVVIQGHDVAGWGLDTYVLPRLASGNLYGQEYPTLHDALDAACASMN